MSISLKNFRNSVLTQLLDLLWRQWAALGVPGYVGSQESNVIDPEALLLLTLTVARHDARLFDEVLTWVDSNGSFLNVHRLQNLVNQYDFQAKAQLSAVAEMKGRKSSVALKWKKLAAKYSQAEDTPLFFLVDGQVMPAPSDPDPIFYKHGLLRPATEIQGPARYFPSEGMPTLLLRLRALLGVNARCEILCVLGSLPEIHPSLIAKLVGQAPRTIQNLMVEMVHSGTVRMRTKAREKIYSLSPGTLDPLLRPNGPTPWVNSVPLFRALEILWLGISDPELHHLENLTLASQWRRLAKQMEPLLGDAGLGQPLRKDMSIKGGDYCEVFVADVGGILGGF